MRRPNHASRFEGIAKTKLQASTASDMETLQSQVNKAAKKRLSLSGLEILHGRLFVLRSGSGAYPPALRSGATAESLLQLGPRIQNWDPLSQRTDIKILYCFHQTNDASKCEAVHTFVPDYPLIKSGRFLEPGGDACACITLSLLLRLS